MDQVKPMWTEKDQIGPNMIKVDTMDEIGPKPTEWTK